MKFNNIFYTFSMITLALLFSCNDDDVTIPEPMTNPPTVNISMNQNVEIATTVNIDGSATTGEGALSYNWNVTNPLGNNVALSNNTATMISFEVSIKGDYGITLMVTNDGGTEMKTGKVTVTNPSFATIDQMGRPAINTVFNFFGDAATKDGYNTTKPDGGNVDSELFKGILDALQGYIGLDPVTYRNVLGLDNATTASVLATDLLMSNKEFRTTYGPADLTDLRLGENLLNGRGLNDDVIDVTLILTFAGDLTSLSGLQQGLISDNVSDNDKTHSDQFPYLASPH
ncbi:MAG: DUF4331 family protein [Saprospiraceae bacterium]